jgi:PEGA domain
MSFQPKASRAVQIWLAVVVGVLIVLFLETRGNQVRTLNFIVNADADDVGAEVLVDNQKAGTITASNAEGPGGGVYLGYLQPGKHVLEVRKEGFKPYSKEIDMHQEQYLGVDLQPLNN